MTKCSEIHCCPNPYPLQTIFTLCCYLQLLTFHQESANQPNDRPTVLWSDTIQRALQEIFAVRAYIMHA